MDIMGKKKIFAGALAAVIALVVCAGFALNIVTLNKISAIEEATAQSDASKEDGVIIAGEYEVKPTTQISDAYISGDDSGLSDIDKKTLKTAEKILKKTIKKDMTDYEKEQAVYEWMQKNIKHDEGMMTVIRTTENGVDCPQGVLNLKKAVCVGYATTFRMFMQMLGIDCMVVHDSELSHTWDLVKIGGSYYHTDIYSDTPSGKFGHFNMTDAMRGNGYIWDSELYPIANSYEYCYAARNAKPIDDVYDIPKLLKKSLEKRETAISFRLPKNDEKTRLIADRILTSAQSRIEVITDFEETYIDWSCVEAGGEPIVWINISYGEEEYSSELDQKTEKKIEKALDKVFGETVPMDEGEILDAATSDGIVR